MRKGKRGKKRGYLAEEKADASPAHFFYLDVTAAIRKRIAQRPSAGEGSRPVKGEGERSSAQAREMSGPQGEPPTRLGLHDADVFLLVADGDATAVAQAD